jgi:hypothetical protein
MSNVINVSVLDPVARTLQTDDYDGQNIVHKHKDKQPITWELVGVAAGDGFVPMTDPKNPGLEWDDPVRAAKAFSGAHVNDTTLRVNDKNNTPVTGGDYYYTLNAMIGGQLYSTVSMRKDPRKALTDPVIINR